MLRTQCAQPGNQTAAEPCSGLRKYDVTRVEKLAFHPGDASNGGNAGAPPAPTRSQFAASRPPIPAAAAGPLRPPLSQSPPPLLPPPKSCRSFAPRTFPPFSLHFLPQSLSLPSPSTYLPSYPLPFPFPSPAPHLAWLFPFPLPVTSPFLVFPFLFCSFGCFPLSSPSFSFFSGLLVFLFSFLYQYFSAPCFLCFHCFH